MSLIDIEKNLKKYLPAGGDTVKKAMRYSTLSGGKRIRPLLVLEAARACSGSLKEAMPAACAAEFAHTYSLIHDDLPAMDDDDVRRGKPACHKVFGEANAILAGDALLTLAFETIARYADPKRSPAIIEELSRAVGPDGMVLGQAMDLEYRGVKKSKATAKKIDALKTARLFEACAKIGAISAGASDKKITAMGRFGLYFGLSFQAVDDHIDGENNARLEAFALVKKAKSQLNMFGKKAEKLKAIADYAVRRQA